MTRWLGGEHFTRDERLWIALASAIVALFAALAVLGLVDGDDAELRYPTTVYNHPPEVTTP